MGLLSDIGTAARDIAGGVVSGVYDGLEKARARRSGLSDVGSAPAGSGPPAAEPEGLVFDPTLVWDSGHRYTRRRGGLSWEALRQIATTPPMAAVINTRCNEVAEFATPRPGRSERHLPGNRIRLRDFERAPTKAEKKRIIELANFVQFCGWVDDPRLRQSRDSLETFFRKLARDSLRFDQATFQVVGAEGTKYGADWKPAAFYAWPAHTMRLALPPDDGTFRHERDYDATRYVQVDLHEQVVVEFKGHEMAFGVRWPRTDIDVGGYGYSEIEQLTDTLSAWLYGFAFNKNYFKNGANTKGALAFKDAPHRDLRRAFEHQFQSMITGVGNAHRVPVLWGASDAKWLAFSQTNKDMEFAAWMDFVFKVFCAICQIDPAQLNFTFGNTGQSTAMGAVDSESKILMSRDRGLRPLVRALFDWLDRWVIYPLDPEFELVPTGIDSRSVDDTRKIQEQEAQTFKTVDEIRAEEDLEPLPDDTGAVILNATWLQAKQGAEAAAMGPGGAQDDGGEAADDTGEADNADDEGDDDEVSESDVKAAQAQLFGTKGSAPDTDQVSKSEDAPFGAQQAPMWAIDLTL